jgi:hypothetical protein
MTTETLILVAVYENSALPVNLVTDSEADAAMREHFNDLDPDTDLCPEFYAIYGRDSKGFYTRKIREIQP